MSGDAAGKEDSGRKPDPKERRKGFLARVWNGIFGGRAEDYEKRLQYLSKEESTVHARMKRRAQGWRNTARNFVICSVIGEVAAVICAIIATRSLDLNWQMRAIRVFPMVVFPGLSYAIYSTLASFIRMCDRKDQKTLERLRAERQAKIDELKERTNYYTTQQLIQKYDLDPAAKAAATTILASKLGADSGLKVFLGDELKTNTLSGKNNGVDLVPSDGLRKRKFSNERTSNSEGSADHQFISNEMLKEIGRDGQEASFPGQRIVEHYKGLGCNEGGWIARVAAMLVGEGPSLSYSLICGNCHMHNGLARKEDFPYVTYYCPHCHALNGPSQPEVQGRNSQSISGKDIPAAASDAGMATAQSVSSSSSTASEAEVGGNVTTIQEQSVEAS